MTKTFVTLLVAHLKKAVARSESTVHGHTLRRGRRGDRNRRRKERDGGLQPGEVSFLYLLVLIFFLEILKQSWEFESIDEEEEDTIFGFPSSMWWNH